MTGLPPDAVVVVTGVGGSAGHAVVRRLVAAGARVVGVDRDRAKLDELRASLGDSSVLFTGEVVDLTDETGTRAWATQVARADGSDPGRVDGVVHLVGGYRGGRTFADNTAEDWAVLHSSLVRTLQNVSLAFHDALVASAASRFVIVSATAVTSPSAGAAGYAAAKAASEAWTFALADSFRKVQASSGAPTAAATVLVVKALVDDAMRAAKPDATFAGFTDVDDLAGEVLALWDADAPSVNGLRRVLAP